MRFGPAIPDRNPDLGSRRPCPCFFLPRAPRSTHAEGELLRGVAPWGGQAQDLGTVASFFSGEGPPSALFPQPATAETKMWSAQVVSSHRGLGPERDDFPNSRV
jgi:hypothetical protein